MVSSPKPPGAFSCINNYGSEDSFPAEDAKHAIVCAARNSKVFSAYWNRQDVVEATCDKDFEKR